MTGAELLWVRFRALTYDAERPKPCDAISGDSPQPYPKDQSGLVRDKPTAESSQKLPLLLFNTRSALGTFLDSPQRPELLHGRLL